MQSVKKDFALRVMTSFKNHVHDPRFICKMEKTAVYFDFKPTRTALTKGKKTVSICICGSSANRCTVCVTVAMDGTKLSLLVIFKGVDGQTQNANLVREDLEAAFGGSRGHVCIAFE
eukprot:IDg22923t1